MESIKTSEKSVLATLRELKVGESATFPASKASYVKSASSQFGFEWNKKFKTSNNRKERTVMVLRCS